MDNSDSRANISRTNTWIALTLISTGLLLRVLSYFFSDNAGGDASARVEKTAQWLQHPVSALFFGAYPPGHFYLIGFLSFLFGDVTFAGRILSLALGIGSLFVVWKLARMLYGDTAGMLSTAVFSLYSLHVGYSATSSSEVSYLFFLLLSMLFFFSYFHEGSNKAWFLAISGTCMSIAESIRYEAWVVFGGLIIIFALIVVWDFRLRRQWASLRPLLIFGITGGIWPVLMMAYSWRVTGDPMYLVHLNRSRVINTLAATQSPAGYQLALIPVVLLISLSPVAFGAAIYGLAKSFSLRLAGAFAGLTLFFAVVQNYEILSRGLLALARYSLTLGTMLAVIAGYGLEQICNKLASRKIRFAQVAVIVILFTNLGLVFLMAEWPNRYREKFASVSPRLQYPKRVSEVGQFLRVHMHPEDGVVIDDYNVESNIVMEAARMPLLPGNRAYLASLPNDIGVYEYIDREHPRFLVYSDRGTLRRSLVLPSTCTEKTNIGRVDFQCDFANDIYRVYELSYR
jgi:4-amino-4-deoxy-L-arabinose transferase-like glycosyltransferase